MRVKGSLGVSCFFSVIAFTPLLRIPIHSIHCTMAQVSAGGASRKEHQGQHFASKEHSTENIKDRYIQSDKTSTEFHVSLHACMRATDEVRCINIKKWTNEHNGAFPTNSITALDH